MVQNGSVDLIFESFNSIEGKVPEISRQSGGALLNQFHPALTF